jgi:glutamate-1-semialdehyde 2,1-aminomutase
MISLREIDGQIWLEELTGFIPQEIFDAHTHLYPLTQAESCYHREIYPVSTWAMLEEIDSQLLPGRTVHRLSFGDPLRPDAQDQVNDFVAQEVKADPASAALMLVRPETSVQAIEDQIRRNGFLGFKPYCAFSSTGDTVECRIIDFLPEFQIEIANHYGLMVMLHLSKSRAISDPENLSDLESLTAKYPRVKWILAHCARSYYDRPLLKAKDRLKQIPNLWYEISSVCDTDAMATLLEIAGAERVMYGSDDLSVGVTRGKYITFGYAWAELNESNHSLGLSHCRPDMTLVRYESLRALSRACQRWNFGPTQNNKIFYENAKALIDQVRVQSDMR